MIQIAIDGPSGAGKSTLAKAVAKALGMVYVDTGALYRTIGYHVCRSQVDPADEKAVEALLPTLRLQVRYEDGRQIVLLNGENPGEAIRTQEIAKYASAVSAIPAVRQFLLETQRTIARENPVVMDGRDIGTVILPDATLKIFLSATPECRARRRYREYLEKGMDVSYEQILKETVARDHADETREIAPLAPATDAILLDNTDSSVEESVEFIRKQIGIKTGKPYPEKEV